MHTNAPERLSASLENKTTLFVQVAVPSPLRATFDYLPPNDVTKASLKPGIRVHIPFGRRMVTGVILSTSHQCTVPAHKLKAVIALLDENPVITADIMMLCQWASRYYHYSLGDILAQALPKTLRLGKPLPVNTKPYWGLCQPLTEAQIQQLKRSPKQLAAAQLLSRSPSFRLSEDGLNEEGVSKAILKGLVAKELVYKEDKPVALRPFSACSTGGKEAAFALNAEQQHALEAVLAHLNTYQPLLLDGITGSGKTEVYLQAIDAVLNTGHQALVLIPEIGLSPQTVSRFKRRFHVPVVSLHSGLSDGERLMGWQQALTETAGIVISTRSGIFTPLPRLGLIIVDEEHDGSYKQQDTFRYNARDLAIYRARQAECPVILGSATPSLETFYNAVNGRYQHLTLRIRAGQAKPPQIDVLDIRQQTLKDGLALDLVTRVSEQLTQGNQVMVFLNRRGYAPSVICHECGAVIDCPHCDAHMTIHRVPPHMHCHHCDYQIAIPNRCSHCQSSNIQPAGQGTERTEQGLNHLFPNYPVMRIDRDSTRKKHALNDMLDTINTGKPCILLGTQMLAKGHHFPDVTLVVVLNADGGLLSADFRGIERTGQLVMQVSGRAGRSHKSGQVVIQTYNPDHPALRLLTSQHYALFLESLLEERATLGLPPLAHLVLVRAESGHSRDCELLLQAVRQATEAAGLGEGVKVLGPIPAPMEKRQNRFRWQLIVQSNERPQLHQAISLLVDYLEGKKLPRHLRWSVDVDPQDMT